MKIPQDRKMNFDDIVGIDDRKTKNHKQNQNHMKKSLEHEIIK